MEVKERLNGSASRGGGVCWVTDMKKKQWAARSAVRVEADHRHVNNNRWSSVHTADAWRLQVLQLACLSRSKFACKDHNRKHLWRCNHTFSLTDRSSLHEAVEQMSKKTDRITADRTNNNSNCWVIRWLATISELNNNLSYLNVLKANCPCVCLPDFYDL